jgi:hypothetical protein
MRIIFGENGYLSMVLEAKYFHGVGTFEVYLLKVSPCLPAGRSKAFSPVCLSRFLGLQLLFTITTQSLGGREGVKKMGLRLFFLQLVLFFALCSMQFSPNPPPAGVPVRRAGELITPN